MTIKLNQYFVSNFIELHSPIEVKAKTLEPKE
jgi:hypothetical protein